MSEFSFNPKNFWKPFLIAAATAFLYATVLAKLGKDWWTDENYSHGLLVPFVIGFIVWLEFDELKRAAKNPQILPGFGMISTAIIILLGGTLGAELFTQRISFVLMLAGFVVYFFGARLLKILVVPFLLLLFAIPIPQIIFNKIAFPLQMWASQMSIWGIRLFEIPSVRKGNVIELLPQGATQIVSLEVVEACSGIRSLMTLVTLVLVLAYFTGARGERKSERFSFLKNFDFRRAMVLMFSAIPIAIVTNAARVSSTAVLTYYYGTQTAENWHEFSGWLVYVFALALLLSVNFVAGKILNSKFKVQSSKFEFQDEAIDSANISAAPRRVSASLLITVLLCGGIFINWFQQRGEVQASRKTLREFPAQIGDWQQRGNDIRFSEQTETVLRASDYITRDYVAADGRAANLYVGYYQSQRSGATYHSPQNCLPGSGWEMKNPQLVEIETPSGKTFTANLYTIQNGDFSEVLIYWYQGRGRANASEYLDKLDTVLDSFTRRRSDGAMVRVIAPIGGAEREAVATATDLAAQTAENLSAFVPE